MSGMPEAVIPYLTLLCCVALPVVCAYTSHRWLDAVLRYIALVVCCDFLVQFECAMHYDEMSLTCYLWVVVMAGLFYQLPLALWGAALVVVHPFAGNGGRLGRMARAILRRTERQRVMLLRSLCFVPLAGALLCAQRYIAETSLRHDSAYAATIYAAALVIILPELPALLRCLSRRVFFRG